jgi:hypothetical protein
MNWIVFSYSLPTKLRSSPRVTLWRRLKRLGAVSLAGGMQVLPAQAECLEAFQWLAQEIRQAKGEALVSHIERFENLSDQALIELFQQARQEEFLALDIELTKLEKSLATKKSQESAAVRESLAKLRKQHSEITRVDYFDCPKGGLIVARLNQIEQALSPKALVAERINLARLNEYKEKRWVTRPRPHVDRLACVWFIRKFINQTASIRYSTQPEPGEIAFDIEGATFGHHGAFCTFETMLETFGLTDPALTYLAQLVHEIDLRDGLYSHPEIEGVDRVLQGWLLTGLSNQDLELHGIALFEGLYALISSRSPKAKSQRTTGARRRKKN